MTTPEKCPYCDKLVDGCTLWPEGDWHDCCLAHDHAYHAADRGGFWARRRADLTLARCVTASGHALMGKVMFLGVRLFGWIPWLKQRCSAYFSS